MDYSHIPVCLKVPGLGYVAEGDEVNLIRDRNATIWVRLGTKGYQLLDGNGEPLRLAPLAAVVWFEGDRHVGQWRYADQSAYISPFVRIDGVLVQLSGFISFSLMRASLRSEVH